MKFSGSLYINKPYAFVADMFADPQYLNKYQDGFVKKELLEGEAGQTGAVSMMYYNYGKRGMQLKETITNNNLPDSFEAFYHHEHMDNTMVCKFMPDEDGGTRFEYEYEYTRVSWIRPKLMTLLFPQAFKKQGDKWMRQFKIFVEEFDEVVKTDVLDTKE